MLLNATPLRKSAPGPPNISDEHVSCTAPAMENASLQVLFKCPTPAIVFGHATKPSRVAHFWQGAQSLASATRNDIWSEHVFFIAFHILTSKCASRHTGVHFVDISTYKSALSRQFLHFWLRNVLRATTACTFLTLQLLKVFGSWGVLYILTSTCASRRNGMHFFISHLASWLRTHRFSEPTFRPSGAVNCWKNTVFRDFPTFSRTWIFFLLRLSLFWSWFFFSSLIWLFPPLLSCVHIVGSLTSKFPSNSIW